MSNLIFKKMNDVMKDIKAVTKDQTNTMQGFKFRGIDQFVNALYPALTKHGVFMTTEVLDYNQEIKDVTRSNGKAGVDKHVSIRMKYTFHAEDGSSVSSSVPAEGLDSGDKATNKALSAALKYTLIQTFSVPTADMAEADLDSPEMGRMQSAPKELKQSVALVRESAAFNLANGGEGTLASATVQPQEVPKKVATFRKSKPSEAPVIAPPSDEWS